MDLAECTPWLEWALGSGPRPTGAMTERDVFGPHPSVLGTYQPISLSVEEYHHAVDNRKMRIVQRFGSAASELVLATATGRHVGAVGKVLPTGRWFSTFVHAQCRSNGTLLELGVQSALPLALAGLGVGILTPHAGSVHAIDPRQLLVGDLEATHWSRAWGLPPRLARVCALLITGERPRAISSALGISIRTVRTYTEQLFEMAGVTSRGELPMAALAASGFRERV